MSTKRQYVYHPGTGTLIALDECELLRLDDETAIAVLDDEKPAPRGEKIDDQYHAVWFTGQAIREHFVNADEAEVVEGLSDGDLDEAGEWAINSAFLWDAVHDAWRYGVEQVREDREAGLSGPI